MVVASPPPRIPLAPDQALTAASTTSCWPIVGAHQLPQFDRSNGCYSLILPDGQITDLLSSPSAKNISLLRRPKSTLQIPPSRPERGALRGRHGRWVRDAVAAAAAGARMRAGRMMLTRTAKSCGPDAPTLASSFAGFSARRRWQESPVTGESTKQAVKTIAQGKLGVPVNL